MIGYYFLRLAIGITGWLPFSLIYRLSDGIAWFLGSVLRYRRQVILSNLSRSFPELTSAETQRIVKKYYRNLSDIALEGLKGMTLDQPSLVERYQFTNPELVQQYFLQGQSVIGLVAHYTNWEWGALVTDVQIHGPVIGVSKSIHNTRIDRYIRDRRSRFGAVIIDMPQTARTIIQHRAQPSLIVLIADQSPSNARNAHWINFLNQETACLIGPDKIALQTNYPVVYFDVQRIKRGFYEITAQLLAETPKDTTSATITKLYFEQLEKVIRQSPENWLWSHKRWKKQRVTRSLSKE